VHTALADEPERRYPTVAAFAEDLQRWLDGVPVRVSGNGLAYRVGKFVRRNALPVALAGVCLALLAAGVAGVVWQSRQTALAAERATTVKNFLADLLTSANPFVRPGATPTVRDLLDQAGRRVETEFDDRPELAAELLGVIGTSYRGLGEMQLADRYLGRAIALSERGSVDADVLGDIQAEYTYALIGRNAYDEAIDSATAALARLPDGSEVVRSRLLIGLATAQLLSGEPKAALQSGEEARTLACECNDTDPAACVQSLIELKYFRQFAGDLPGALQVAQDAWQRAEQMHAGTENPQRVQAAGAYGDALSINERTDEAIEVLGEAVDLARTIYGEHNFRYARALDWYASALDDAWRLPESIDATEQALAIAHAAMPRSPMSATMLHRLARLQLDLWRTEDAETTLARRDEWLPDPLPDHVVGALALDELRLRLQRDGATPEVVDDTAALADGLAEAGGTMSFQADLVVAQAALETGDVPLAERLLARAGTNAGDTPLAQARLARAQALLRATGDGIDAALEATSAVRRTFESMTPVPVTDVYGALRAEAGLLCRGGRTAEGLRRQREAIAYWHEHVDGTRLPERVATPPSGCPYG
jgi:tetratricopeptide (TPR) repeat protein